MADTYIVITQRAWCNDSGYGISYESDLEQFDSRTDVVNHGIDITGSDDFNVGTVRNGNLVAFEWMERPVNGHNLPAIAGEIGLGGDHA